MPPLKKNYIVQSLRELHVMWYIETYPRSSKSEITYAMCDAFGLSDAAVGEYIRRAQDEHGLIEFVLEPIEGKEGKFIKYYKLTEKGEKGLNQRRFAVKRAFF